MLGGLIDVKHTLVAFFCSRRARRSSLTAFLRSLFCSAVSFLTRGMLVSTTVPSSECSEAVSEPSSLLSVAGGAGAGGWNASTGMPSLLRAMRFGLGGSVIFLGWL